MKTYLCNRCGKDFVRQQHLHNHMKRKKPCFPETATSDDVKSGGIPVKSGGSPDPSGKTPVNSGTGTTPANSGEPQEKTTLVPNQCSYCRFVFKRSDYLRDHLHKGRCHVQKEVAKNNQNQEELFRLLLQKNEEDRKRIDELTQIVLQQQRQITSLIQAKAGISKGNNNISNSNINTGVVNNITVQFGRETTEGLTRKEKLHILQAGTRSLLECIKTLHFEPNRPEYHNVYVSNLRSNIGMIFKDNRFMVESIETIVDDLVDNRLYDVENLLQELADTLPDSKVRRVQAMVERMKNEEASNTDKDFVRELKTEIVRLLYNYRDVVNKTHALALTE